MGKEEMALSVAAGSPASGEPAAVGSKRSSTSRMAALVGGLALVGAAVGLVGVGVSNAARESSSEAAGPSYSAELVGEEGVTAAGVRGSGVKGKADLDVHNVLTWALRKLEPETSGTIHIHAGRSCDALGSSLWDTEVTSNNPWTSVTWTSDNAGKSAGTLNIDDLAGAYSFPANLGHAVVFYSHDEHVLACGVLKPEGDYRKFGVQSVLNNGFAEHHSSMVAGEVILSKDNVLSWGIYNLQAEQSGVVSVLAGRDCNNPGSTWFTGEWVSDKWGISRTDLALDSSEHDFAEVVGRAVVIRDPHGAVVACDTLSLFVERTPTAVREVRAELRDIVNTYKSEGYNPSDGDDGSNDDDHYDDSDDDDHDDDDDDDNNDDETPVPPQSAVAAVEPVQNLGFLCEGIGSDARTAAEDVFLVFESLAIDEPAYDDAIVAVSGGIASNAQIELIETYESKRDQTKPETLAVYQSLVQLYNNTCRLTPECDAIVTEFRDYEYNRHTYEKYAIAVAAVEDGSATQEQKDTAAEYYALMESKASIDNNLDARVDEMDSLCYPNVICDFNEMHNRCTKHQYFTESRRRVAGRMMARANKSIKFAELQREYQAALRAQSSGTETEEQRDFIYDYGRLQYAAAKNGIGRSLHYINTEDRLPIGNITLTSQNILSWQLVSPPRKQIGRIIIHEGTTCDELGGQAARDGTSPYNMVSWDTTEETGILLLDERYHIYSTEGSVDLKTLDGVLPFSSNYPRAVAVYSVDLEPLSCGVLTLQ